VRDLNQDQSQTADKEIKKVKAQVKCPHCGQEHEVEVEVPEASETPKVGWEV
jgi:transcription elongation factor Elf1